MADFYLGKKKDVGNLIAHTFRIPLGEHPGEIGVVRFISPAIPDDAQVLGVYREGDEEVLDLMSGKSFKAYTASVFPTFHHYVPLGN